MRKLRWEWVMGLRFASGDITDIILTLARLMASTDLTGLRAECLAAPAPGMAGDAPGVGVAGAGVAASDEILTGMIEGSAVAVSPATEALTAGASMEVAVLTVAALTTVRRASAAVTGSAATVDFMVEVVGSTEVAASTAAAVAGFTAGGGGGFTGGGGGNGGGGPREVEADWGVARRSEKRGSET